MSDTTFSPGDRVRHRFSNQPGTVLKVHVNNVDVRYDNSPERFITFADFLVRDLTTPNGDGKVHPRAHAFRTTASVVNAVLDERERQDKKWGRQDHAFAHWMQVLGEELGECSRAYLEKKRGSLRAELVQAAAVLVAMVECGDRNGWFIDLDRRSGKVRRLSVRRTFPDVRENFRGTERRAPNCFGRRVTLGDRRAVDR